MSYRKEAELYIEAFSVWSIVIPALTGIQTYSAIVSRFYQRPPDVCNCVVEFHKRLINYNSDKGAY